MPSTKLSSLVGLVGTSLSIDGGLTCAHTIVVSGTKRPAVEIWKRSISDPRLTESAKLAKADDISTSAADVAHSGRTEIEDTQLYSNIKAGVPNYYG